MYNLHLTSEQLEIRDTVRDFVNGEIKSVVLKAGRLDAGDRTLSMELLEKASQMGLRTLALSEALGGAGADALTACLVTEELAAGDADIAGALTETSRLGHILFDRTMSDALRDRFLPTFLNDDGFHLAFAQREQDSDSKLGVNYRRAGTAELPPQTRAAKASDGSWIVDGTKIAVANAPVARLFAVEVAIPGRSGTAILLVPADASGVAVHAYEKAWHHGPCGDVTFKECRVPANHLLDGDAAALLKGADAPGRGIPLAQALNLGIARAAYEAAVEYAKLRVQGGRPIIEHQAIGTKLAECAIRLDVARTAVWRAAWASDHPEAYADGSLPDLPLQTVAQVFTSEALLKATKDATEVFGAMGVMRDMPLQKYVHDARVCLHSGDGNTDARLRIAEALAGYRRMADAGALALAGE
ncbi:MAG TPA: acyl-CoA dehydrogenase family protein [Pseudolabrys sp.]|nr:acyl-CoA dehydrogenase family protein [Pseudolabrys sp.]